MTMIRLFRICDPRFAQSPEDMLSGEGASLFGGRWSSAGHRVVYFAQSLSLAAYELLVHVPDQVVAPFKRICVQVPEELIIPLDETVLPEDWQRPGHPDLPAIGDAWIRSNESLGLSLPSALVPGERNVLLRPDHPDISAVEVGTVEDFRYDPRLSQLKR